MPGLLERIMPRNKRDQKMFKALSGMSMAGGARRHKVETFDPPKERRPQVAGRGGGFHNQED